MYSDDTIDIFNILNRFAFSKLFNIPDSNKISINEFKKQLELLGFEVVITDITDKTFKPYYKYFFNNVQYPSNFILHEWVFNIIKELCGFYINTLCNGTNGLKYIIATCEK